MRRFAIVEACGCIPAYGYGASTEEELRRSFGGSTGALKFLSESEAEDVFNGPLHCPPHGVERLVESVMRLLTVARTSLDPPGEDYPGEYRQFAIREMEKALRCVLGDSRATKTLGVPK